MNQPPAETEIILTGLRTNAGYHLGNYIGALLPVKRLIADKLTTEPGRYQVNLFAPDLHSFTTPVDYENLYQQTLTNLKLMAACCQPPAGGRVYLYRQSAIAGHSELTWLLLNFTGFGQLQRMVEFKDKSARLGPAAVSAGLFNYPVLMAADILLYRASWVPVGDDQRQHLEFCRQLAASLNGRFGKDLFLVPRSSRAVSDFLGHNQAPRIKNLKQPADKMSKSSAKTDSGIIWLSDQPQTVNQKIATAVTDDIGQINYDPDQQPAISNLLTILAHLEYQGDQAAANKPWLGQTSYKKLKDELSRVINRHLTGLRADLAAISDEQLLQQLQDNEAVLRLQAQKQIRRCQQAFGLRAA